MNFGAGTNSYYIRRQASASATLPGRRRNQKASIPLYKSVVVVILVPFMLLSFCGRGHAESILPIVLGGAGQLLNV